MVEVFKRSLQRRYYTNRMSTAYLIWAIFTLSCIIVPYFIAFSSQDFWKTEGYYREQPSLKFKRKMVMILETQDPSSPLIWSTIPQYNEIIGSEFIRAPVVRTTERDTNLDGIIDYCNISLSVNLQKNEKIHRVTLLLFFDSLLQNRVRMAMEGMAYIDYSSVQPGMEYTVNGDLLFQQLNPLVQNVDRTVYMNSVLNPQDLQTNTYAQTSRILTDYFARNETLSLEHPYSYWESGVGNTFKVNVQTRIPTQNIQYIPGPVETSKFAWIQYLSLLIPFYILSNKIRSFVYQEQVAVTTVIADSTPLGKLHEF